MAVLRYTLLRLGLVAAALLVFWLIGLRGWLLGVVSIVVAALLSFLILQPQADAAAGQLAARGRRGRQAVDRSIAQDAAEEDALLDGEQPPPNDER